MTLFVKAIPRPVLRYHGGKFIQAARIIEFFPDHKVFVDGYGGAGNIIMQKQPSYSEVYNDKWDVVVNVFRCMRDPILNARLKEQLELTPFARTEFNDCSLEGITDPVERARRTIFRSFAGFGSASTNQAYTTGFRANANKSGTTPAHDWCNYPKCLPLFLERMRGIIIENRDAIQVFEQQDSLKTLHYADPPYVKATRNLRRSNAHYVHEMEDDDHRKLATCLRALRGFVILSGYRCKLYDELFGNWERVDFPALGDGACKRTESLWFNHRAWQHRPALLLG